MTAWESFGFSENPYSAKPIPPTAVGERLLVGRDAEIAEVITALQSSDTHCTLEGSNGVGKTSLVSVAGFKLLEQFRSGTSQQLIIPIDSPFQLTPDSEIAGFKRRVLYAIAQSLLSKHDLLRRLGTDIPDVANMNMWLNSPAIGSGGIGVSVAGFGVTGNMASSPNESAGFADVGFEETIKKWLRDCFPSAQKGAVVCVLDNLELLQTSATARRLLEAARDEVFGLPGVKWVLCGARGIVRSSASSPRLQGVLSDPINIVAIADEHIPELISRRVAQFSAKVDVYVPVEADGFRHLYEVGNKNLRNALKYCEDFSLWLLKNETRPNLSSEKSSLIEIWFAELADKYTQDTTEVRPRAWSVFDGIVGRGGSVSPSDYQEFEFESAQAMRPHLKALEDSQLIDSEIDETDNRRKTITITPRGWIVSYQRAGFNLVSGTHPQQA